MPRAKTTNSGSSEPKRRSRNGCAQCKQRKIKCDEVKPKCASCTKLGQECDYSIKLQWGGRSKKDQDAFAAMASTSPGFPTINFAPPSVPPAPSGIAAEPTLPTPTEPQVSITEAPSRGNFGVIDPQLSSLDRPPGYHVPPNTIANRYPTHPEPSASYNSLPRFPLPYSTQPTGSPSDHSFRSPSVTHSPLLHEFSWSNQDRSKRVRLSSVEGSSRSLPPIFARPEVIDSPAASASPYDNLLSSAATYVSQTSAPSPLTPGSSVAQGSPGVRRLSVHSLLSGPIGDHSSPGSFPDRNRGHRKVDSDGYVVYGYDYGTPDLDMPKNDDFAAINPRTPAGSMQSPSASETAWSPSQLKDSVLDKPAFEGGGYYARPVPIRIPKELEPLPPHLTESPMNLMYFHHFLNHTARILVPHDCPDNPLKTTLPQIAVKNANLLNLLLAYSALHRARLLSHPEPSNRIAFYMRDLFPDLRRSLSSNEPVSNATLATAIMLASRECINPNSLDVPIPWQTHLQIARQMIISRGGVKDMGENGEPFVNVLARWFAFLDVIGSLSGPRNEAPLSEEWLALSRNEKPDDHGFAIDCFFGFTNCCISLLARLAKLAHECDAQRFDAEGNIDPDWKPSQETVEQAKVLKQELSESRRHAHRGCRHNRGDDEKSNEKTRLEVQEMVSVNESFHLAGLIHLDRRVLGKPSNDKEVQECVKLVVQALQGVRRGGTAESSLLFPMFTAGCDARDSEDREMILERFKLVEGLGMMHVRKARQIMEKSWETGRPWETLVSGEFFG